MANAVNFSADFIVVGGGTSGCLIASQLASKLPDRTVLLIEAGTDTRDLPVRSPEHRYMIPFLFPEFDYGYMTAPQTVLNNRQVPYLRGKGLGGSSISNFMTYHYGPAAEYDYWADLVGDDIWRWKNVKPKFHKLETYNGIQEGHGKTGPIQVSVPLHLDWATKVVLEGMRELEHPLHLDINSGDPIGVTMNASSQGPDGRETGATIFLTKVPPNLEIICSTRIVRVEFNEKRAVGVAMENGTVARASQEVILCAGSIESPKLLLLSGVGSPERLTAVGVQPRHTLPGVGQNLHDHVGVGIMHKMSTEYLKKHEAGDNLPQIPLAHHSMAVTYSKLSCIFESEEFLSLNNQTQQRLRQNSVPHFEFAGPSFNLAPHLTSDVEPYLSVLGVAMNPQSRGEIRLSSSDPSDPPHIDPKLLDHPFDRKVIIEGMKEMMALHRTMAIARFCEEDTLAPADFSDAAIWEYVQANAQPALHAAGSLKMGHADDELACVDTNFQVKGLEALRVADMSVCPVLISNHPQSTAYLIGAVAVEKIIMGYRA